MAPNLLRECLVCNETHKYKWDYVTCEFRELESMVFEIKLDDFGELRKFLAPKQRPVDQ